MPAWHPDRLPVGTEPGHTYTNLDVGYEGFDVGAGDRPSRTVWTSSLRTRFGTAHRSGSAFCGFVLTDRVGGVGDPVPETGGPARRPAFCQLSRGYGASKSGVRISRLSGRVAHWLVWRVLPTLAQPGHIRVKIMTRRTARGLCAICGGAPVTIRGPDYIGTVADSARGLAHLRRLAIPPSDESCCRTAI